MHKPFQISDEMKIDMDILEAKIQPEREPVLAEREKTHGSFLETAECAQHLKTVFRSTQGWGNLTAVQRESVDMMCSKFSRILCGNPDTKDHWDDISGYAKLVAEQL